MKSKANIFRILFFLLIVAGCTKLKETAGGNLTPGQVSTDTAADVLLRATYASLEYTFTSYQEMLPLTTFTTDEAIAPTRGGDWDDNASWRVFHEQKWDADNSHIRNCFNSLGGVVYAATDLLKYNATVQQKAEARFLRAWAMYLILDMFDQVPYRDPGESLIEPARVRQGLDALAYIIDEINAVEPDLPDGPADVANKFAAKTLLMKCYLNKAVYANRASPTHDPADMDKVIALADQIINSGNFDFSIQYFNNFSPTNAADGKENIFTQQSNADGNYVLQFAWQAVTHYYQGGFNGFTTLSDFYNKFEATDKRRGIAYDYSNSPPNPGRRVNVGFLADQQYNLEDDSPLDFGDGPLIYTPEVTNILPGPNLAMPGIRPLKYPPDNANFDFRGTPCTNEYVYFRFPDVLLMKAEAIWRGGAATSAGPYGNTALLIVNAVRTAPSRSATALTTLSADDLLDERGRELWWEGWRRQDMIRFGKFLLPFQEKNYASDPKYLLFPIPSEQLAVNQLYLHQNPGY